MSRLYRLAPWLLVVACTPTDVDQTHVASTLSVDGDLLVNSGQFKLIANTTTDLAPEMRWVGANGEWSTGIDTANAGGPRDLVLAGKAHWPSGNQVDDLIYVAHNGELAPTVGVGVTPPDHSHRLQVSAQDSEPAMGTLVLRRTLQQLGNLLTMSDSAGASRLFVDSDFWLKGDHPAVHAALAVKGDDVNQRPLALARANGDSVYGFQYAPDATGTLFLRYVTGGLDVIGLRTDGNAAFPHGITTAALQVQPSAVPASSSSPCTQGQLVYDDSYVYVCVSTNTWKRSALSSW